jgi:DmsE family decaheme c-type cytochrome
VKDRGGIEVEFCSAEASSTPAREATVFILNRILISVAASALMFWPLLGLSQSAKAETFTVADINATLRGLPQAASSEKRGQPHQLFAEDHALSELSSFAHRIEAGEPKPDSAENSDNPHRQFEDGAFLALWAYAQRIDAAKPQAIEAGLKLADADNALDALREFLQKGSPPQPPSGAKTPKTPAAAPEQPIAPVAASYVGANVCLTCHASQAESFGHTLMGRIGMTQKGKFDCENCHGPGSAHVKAGGGIGVGGLISFRPNDQSHTADETNAICLSCHERGDRTNWPGSTHETRGLECSNCHTIMQAVSRKNQLKTVFEPDTCFQCHKDRRAQMFRSSHMPMREGKVVCSDCHNPHGSVTEALLREDSINDTCYKCHAEKRGPFLFEHEPVRENCLNCHDPHGSVNEFSLKMSRPRLCFECHGFGHGQGNGPNSPFTMGLACQNCHINIHGSNSPAGGAFQR